MIRKMKIGIVDSGVGGLTVLNTLANKFPNNEYIYYGDNKNFPYGNKSLDELKALCDDIIHFLIKKEVEIIIFACGTLSSSVFDYVKNKYKIKFYSVIETTIEYINNSNYKNVGVIATMFTINTHIFKNSINKNVYELSCPNLANLIEDLNYLEINKYIFNNIKKLESCDALIMGCTHYSVIKENIQKIIPNVTLIDMGEYIALSNNGNKSSVDLYFTKLDNKLNKNINNILDVKIDSINLV